MNESNELKTEILKLMHELIKKNKEIFEESDYSNLTSLCAQDIAILSCVYEHTKETGVPVNTQDNIITAKEISIILSIPKTTAVSAVERLEKKGYLVKSENVMDKREKLLCLTEKGLRANYEHMHYENVIIDSLVSMWDTKDQASLAILFKKRRRLSK